MGLWAAIPPVADASKARATARAGYEYIYMTNHKNPDLASQLGDLALDTRVQLRDLTSRPELNGR